ncbi:hypothetical protein [Streptomyces pilosus]|uniref:Uncharacterized protein n=1 Tax=Streptomyces pilosus TaxID=28893 RepID=A0A918F4V6_9ACTN|nr:hypothetical protein [Streptomyces pilosus]GGR01122.1 hypothetical protein GCM10010280_56410 [Streptomyces pilosus]
MPDCSPAARRSRQRIPRTDEGALLPLTALRGITRREGRGFATWNPRETHLRGLGVVGQPGPSRPVGQPLAQFGQRRVRFTLRHSKW